MEIEKLYKKYGKKVIDNLMSGRLLDGNTIISDEKGNIVNIPEIDIIRAIRKLRGENIGDDWD